LPLTTVCPRRCLPSTIGGPTNVCPRLLFALDYCVPSTTVCLYYCLPSTTVCPQLLFALNCCLPSTAVCPQRTWTLSTTRAPEGSTRATACLQRNAVGVHAQQQTPLLVYLPLKYLTHKLRLVHARRQYSYTVVPHTQPHHPYLFNIQDGRRNARCAALSTWGARTRPAVATAWFELLM